MKKVILFLFIIFSMQLMAADITVTKTAEQLGTQYEWKSGNTYFYGTFQLDNVVTFCAEQPDADMKNGYYSSDSPRDWRIYQARNNGKFTVSVRPGYTIRSLKFVYTNKNTGVLSLVAGTNVDAQYQVASGQTLRVDTNSITFYAGNTTATTNGQVKISQFTVTYYATDTAAVVERFSKVEQPKNNDEEVTWQGDYADWKVLHARRNAKDTLNGGVQGSWCKGGAYFKTVAQGGIKQLRFEWRQFVTDSVELVLAMSAGEVWKDTARMRAIAAQAASKNYNYEASIQCKQDALLSFMNLCTTEEKDRFLLGDFYITPYIYIAPENRSISLEQADGSFDIASILQNNTEGEGEIVYAILSDATGAATLSGSVVDFSKAITSGDILVQAFWNDSLVTTAPVTLHISVMESEGEAFVETFSHCKKTQMTGTTYIAGDEGVFGWNMTNFIREATDTIRGIQGTRVGYNGSITMNGVQEGGIKSIAFYWRAASAAHPVAFTVRVDGTAYNYSMTTEQSKGEMQQYTRAFNIAHNTAFSFEMGAQASPQQSKIIVGEVEITPYLLFRVKRDTVDIEQTMVYALDSMLINNTKEAVTYSILKDETGAAVLNGSTLDLQAVTKSGTIQVQAAWDQVTTTINIYAQLPATGLFSTHSTQPATRSNKVLKNGQLVIIHDGQMFNAQGACLCERNEE